MTELTPGMTVEDLVLPGSFISTRDVGDVLIGEDSARPLLEACSSGDDAALKSLLSQPRWMEMMFERPPTIYKEKSPREGPNDARKVSARRMKNIERGFALAVENHHAPILSTLKAVSKSQGIRVDEFMAKDRMIKMISNEYAWVWEALASADPDIVNFHCHHGALVLYEAVRMRRAELVEVLLRYGADPLHPVQSHIRLGSFNSSLMSRAASSQTPRMTKLLLERGVPIKGTAALHSAAAFGRLDTMRLLIEHGADLNEVISDWNGWTPMHFAAERRQVDAMELLEQSGARSDCKDPDGKTPAQILEIITALEESRRLEESNTT